MTRLRGVLAAERAAVALLLLLLLASLQPNEATRLLDDHNDDEDPYRVAGLVLQVLQAGSVPTPGNGCTGIPGSGGSGCIGSRKSAGRTVAAQDAYLPQLTQFNVADQH